jgi:hypothetical protein
MINEKSVSKSQQRLMGQIYGVRKFMDSGGKEGLDPKDVDPKYREMIVQKAKEWEGKKSLKSYASTKHKGLPDEVVKESSDLSKLSFLIGKPIKLIKTLHTTGNYDSKTNSIAKVKKEEEVNGLIGGFDNEGGFSVPYMIISTPDGSKVIGHIIWDQKRKEFIEGYSSFHYVYSPADEASSRNLDLFKINYYEEMQESEVPTIYPYLNPDSKKAKKKTPESKMQNLADYREFISKKNKK